MTDRIPEISDLPDEALALLLKDAQAEQARRNSGRMSLSDIRRCFSEAAHQLKGDKAPDFKKINWRLANIGVRMIVVEGRLYLEKVASQ